MKTNKQIKVLAILEAGRYKEEIGDIYTFKKGEWKKLKPNLLPTGYKQVHIFNGIRYGKGLSAIIYVHQLVYLINKGQYQDRYAIDHIDRDKSNNNISNLRAVNTALNLENQAKRGALSFNPIRSKEIASIKELLTQGMSIAAIARTIERNRISVMYIVKKIRNNEPLKYE
jgi:hypothetical protein